MSTALLALSYPYIDGGSAGPVEVLSAYGGFRSTAPEAHVTVMEPRLFVCTAGCAAGPPNPVASVFEVFSARRGSRSSAPEASLMLTLDPPPLIALKPRLIARRVPTALLSLSYPSIAGGAAGLSNPVVSPVEVLSACGGSRSTAPEARVTVMEPAVRL